MVSEPNYHTTKFFMENLLAIEMIKSQILINKAVSLGLSILGLSKNVMYKFWYDNVNQNIAKIQNFVIWIQTAKLFP